MLKHSLWFAIVTLVLANFAATAYSSPPPVTEIQQPASPLNADDDARRDAEVMANDLGISVDEAIRRRQHLDLLNDLNLGAALEQQEAETFAGIWIQQVPEYRIVVAFTRNGEETIRPYIANTPLADVVDVRTVDVTYAELEAAQQEVHQRLDRLKLSNPSAISVQENRVELYVSDRAQFEQILQQANVELPDHVEVVATDEPRGAW